jgi:NADH dehydrogenase
MARLLVDAGERQGNSVIDAVGPETFSFEELVMLIAERVGRSIQLIHLPTAFAYASTIVTGWMVGDVVLTWEEYKGLMGNLLAPDGPAAGQTRLSLWLAENSERVGRNYASEVARHFTESRT